MANLLGNLKKEKGRNMENESGEKKRTKE